VPEAHKLGARIEHVGVNDVVLPGEMKALLNRVIEAEKAERRPVLLRLKELEALTEIASHIHKVRVVVGADGLKTLLPAGQLGNRGGKVEPKPGEIGKLLNVLAPRRKTGALFLARSARSQRRCDQ
jgi:hypothetical protein